MRKFNEAPFDRKTLLSGLIAKASRLERFVIARVTVASRRSLVAVENVTICFPAIAATHLTKPNDSTQS